MKIQHLALKTNNLGATYAFYTDVLGCHDASYDPDVGRVWLSFADRSDEPLYPATVQ